MSFEDGIKIEVAVENIKAEVERRIDAGEMRKSVASDIDDIVRPRLAVENGQVVDRQTGISDPAKLVAAMLSTRDHWAPTKSAPDLEEQAFGAVPSLSARGVLLKTLGPAEYAERMAAWGANMSSLKPGSPPPGEGAKAAPKQRASTNPWSDDPAHLDKFGRYNAVALRKQSNLVVNLGVEKSAAIAKSAGAFLGATMPNCKRLIAR